MRRRALFLISNFLFVTSLFAGGGDNHNLQDIKSVDAFFTDGSYEILSEKLVLADREIRVAVNFINKEKGIFDKALCYESEDNGIIVQLLINNGKIINRRNELLANVSSAAEFYGFSIFYSYPTKPGFDIGFSFTGYFDERRSPADPPISIDWDSDEKVFYKFVLDWDNL